MEGLYNRTTRQIAVKPFTLTESAEYYASKGLAMNTQDIIESHMILFFAKKLNLSGTIQKQEKRFISQ